jgi:hypothetical protein
MLVLQPTGSSGATCGVIMPTLQSKMPWTEAVTLLNLYGVEN